MREHIVKIAWSAIVKNEEKILERCVQSLLPHIDCAIIIDTGSTDSTPELLMKLFAAAGKPLELRYAPFENFAQARNEALRIARASSLDWQYLLLSDADMNLVVDDPNWTQKLNGGLAYDVRQIGGSLSYWNRRLLNRSAQCRYECPTHEYLDIAAAGAIDGIHFIDHADGANRPEKFARDIALLESALKTETRPGLVQRFHFYLGQSYFDVGNWESAAFHYWKRIALGGYAEEQWYAQMRLALCLRNLGRDADFLLEMLSAYRMRPQRAETLYELARHFRLRGDNFVSLLFTEAGLQLPYPKDDHLFVDAYAHNDGLKEEFAICAYYDPLRRRRGATVADKLALSGSEQAQFNLFWYLRPLSDEVTSFREQIVFVPPDGYVAMNPSVINYDGTAKILVRTVNYTITDDGQYRIRGADGAISDRAPISTRNFIGDAAVGFAEIGLPLNWPDQPLYPLVRGFEDSRLFRWQEEFYTLSTVRELSPEGWCEQVLAPIVRDGAAWRYGNDWRRIAPASRHEKNWMPWIRAGELQFVYRLGTLVDLDGKVIEQFEPRWKVGHISGGSQVVEIDNRTYLALVHEARTIPGRSNRYYQHRFVVFDRHGRPDAISAPFFFHDKQIEFCAGLAFFLDKQQLMISYGIMDKEAWIAIMDPDQVVRFAYRSETS
jgi:glycosyltransferase involved in cell wall biosynthesis